MQYKPTKQKKEKPAKAPKAPKAEKQVKLGSAMSVKTNKPVKAPKPPKAPKAPKNEKPAKFGSAMKLKTNKPVKEPKQPKVPKSEKMTNTPIKVGKVENASSLEKTNVLKKPLNIKVLVAVLISLVVVTVLLFTVVIPAIKRHGQKIESIMISSVPDKVVYLIGEEIDYRGLRILVTRNNGESLTVRAENCQISGFDSTREGYKYISVIYEGFNTGFNVKVEQPPRPTPALVRISLETLPKTEYKLGERLDTSGGVISCEYADGSVYRVNLVNGHVSGFKNVNGPGKYELTVKYKENGTLCTTTYQITVSE